MNLEPVRTIADRMLPRVPSAESDRRELLMPRSWAKQHGHTWWLESQLLVAPLAETPRLTARVRLLQVERRTNVRDGQTVLIWDKDLLREAELEADLDGSAELMLDFPGAVEETSSEAGKLTCESLALHGRLVVAVTRIAAALPLLRVAVRVENTTHLTEASHPALMAAFISTHLLFGVTGAELISFVDPPPWARRAATACRSAGTCPTLADPQRALSWPIVMEDPFASQAS